MFYVALLQTYVAVERIDQFLKEDEVPTFVSTLKMAEAEAANPNETNPFRDPKDEKIGFVNASFKFTTGTVVPEDPKADKVKKDAKPKKKDAKKDKKNGVEEQAVVVAQSEADAAAAIAEDAVRVFELQDLKFIFPSGGLTIVTGQTGAGKVRALIILFFCSLVITQDELTRKSMGCDW